MDFFQRVAKQIFIIQNKLESKFLIEDLFDCSLLITVLFVILYLIRVVKVVKTNDTRFSTFLVSMIIA